MRSLFCSYCGEPKADDELFVVDRAEYDENQRLACGPCLNEIEELDDRARQNSSAPPSNDCDPPSGVYCGQCIADGEGTKETG